MKKQKEQPQPICIYSNTFDGWCSAAIVKKKYSGAKFIEYKEGTPLKAKDGVPIILVDVILPREAMVILAKSSGGAFEWISHNVPETEDYVVVTGVNSKTSFNVEMQKFSCLGVDFDLITGEKSSCELTWEHFFPSRPLPEMVKLIGEFASNRKENNPRWKSIVLPFHYGMQIACDSFETFPVGYLDLEPNRITPPLEKIITSGRDIIKFGKIAEKASRFIVIGFVSGFKTKKDHPGQVDKDIVHGAVIMIASDEKGRVRVFDLEGARKQADKWTKTDTIILPLPEKFDSLPEECQYTGDNLWSWQS